MLKSLQATRILSNVSGPSLNIATSFSSLKSSHVLVFSTFFALQRRSSSTRISADNHVHDGSAVSEETVAAWIAELDPYLPLEIRSRSWQDNLENFNGIRSVETLPQILATSNQAFPNGILTHVALLQKRWSAVLYLSRVIFDFENKPALNHRNPLKGSPWSVLPEKDDPVDKNFLETYNPYWDLQLSKVPENPLTDEPPLEYLTGTSFRQQDQAPLLWKSAIGQIWRCLGHVMIAATRENSPLQVDMINFVLQVVASMHSKGIVSEEIYLFEHNEVPSEVRKPPFLHLMSSRMMTALSDIMWKKTEPDLMKDIAYVVAKHSHKGQQSPAGDFGPRLRPLGHEVWLEFILWSCVYGNHFKEGIELISALSQGPAAQPWKTVSWQELQDILDAKILEQNDSRMAQSWYQRLASSLEGYSEDAPMIELGRNTISREVVARLYDGRLSTVATRRHEQDVNVLRNVLVSDEKTLGDSSTLQGSNTTRSTLYRLVENNSDNKVHLADEGLVDLGKEWSFLPGLSTSDEQQTQLESNPRYSLLVQAIAHHVDNANIHKALQSYGQLKIWAGSISDGTSSADLSSQNGAIPPTATPLVDHKFILPSSVLAPFINLITRLRMLDVGKELLSPFSSGKHDLHAEFVIQRPSSAILDAMVSFAGATSDNLFFSEMWRRQHLKDHQISDTRFRELLHFQVRTNQWRHIRNSLTFMTKKRKLKVLPQDVTRIAARIVHLEGEGMTKNSEQLMDILSTILRGDYKSLQSRGAIPDWTEARELNQMARILSSLPIERFSVSSKHIIADGQLSNPIELPVSAFNTLLEAIVDVVGAAAGLSLVQSWCSLSAARKSGRFRPGDREFRCIEPDLQTFRILVKPFTSLHEGSFKATALPEDNTVVNSIDWSSQQGSITGLSAIVTEYYGEIATSEELDMLAQVMHWCKESKLDEDESFRTLLQPMDEQEEISEMGSATSTGHGELAIERA